MSFTKVSLFIGMLLFLFAVCLYIFRPDGRSDLHSCRWELGQDGTWSCSCGQVLESTTGSYVAVLSHGRPVEVTIIKGHNYTYENTSGKSRKMVIKTRGGTLTINAPKDTVWIFGHASDINVVAAKKVLYGD